MFRAARIVGLALAACLIAAATVQAQQYVPLRYDLRQGSPHYIPSGGILHYGTEGQGDPYSFEAMRNRDYIVTGNVRAGKSFQGNVPYDTTGSGLSRSLPSLSLSDFRRDSFGVQDLGTGVEYGRPLPYVPYSSRVTTGWTAGLREQYGYNYPPVQPGPAYGPYGYTSANESLAPFRGYVPAATYENLPGVYGGPSTYGPASALGNVPLPPEVWDYLEGLADAEVPDAWLGPQQLRYGAPDADEGYVFRPTGWDEEGADFASPPEETAMELDGQTTRPPAATEVEGEGRWSRIRGLARARALPSDRYGLIVTAAHAAFRKGEYADAAKLYREALAENPSRTVALFGRVHALLANHYYNQAAVVLEQALEQRPDLIGEIPNPRDAFPDEGAYEAVLADVREKLEGDPDERELNFLLGYLLYAADKPEEARPYLARASAALKHLTSGSKVLLGAVGGGEGEAAGG